MIYIRVDGNSNIGMGHVMRCLSIAEKMVEQDINPVFITACDESAELLFSKKLNVFKLNTDYREMEQESVELNHLFEGTDKEKNVILIDSYQMTNKYIENMKKYGSVVCMDDEGHAYPADMIINYNIYAKELAYEFEKESPKMLLGASYIPLREEFTQDCEFELKDEVHDILITTGGGDPLFAAPALVNALLQNGMLQRKNIVYHIVSGPVNQHAEELKDIYLNHPKVMIHENVISMKELMQSCDVIISAAGSTVYEAASLGIPMICFYFVENQRRIAEFFDKNTDVINCGDYSENPSLVCENLVDATIRCVYGRMTRKELFDQEKVLVDGLGAERIAQELIEIMNR